MKIPAAFAALVVGTVVLSASHPASADVLVGGYNKDLFVRCDTYTWHCVGTTDFTHATQFHAIPDDTWNQYQIDGTNLCLNIWGGTNQLNLYTCSPSGQEGNNEKFRNSDNGFETIGINHDLWWQGVGAQMVEVFECLISWQCTFKMDGSKTGWNRSNPLLVGRTYSFRPGTNTSSCLDVTADGHANLTRMEEWSCNGGPAQAFTVVDAGNGLVSLRHVDSGRCVDIYNNSSTDGAGVEIWDCNGGPAQTLEVLASANGSVTFFNPNSGKCLDVTGASGMDGTSIELWDCNDGPAQQWYPNLR